MLDKKINIKILIKAGVIGFLLLLMLIPLGFVKGIMAERQSYKKQALDTISSSWGADQLLASPFIEVPYKYTTEVREQNTVKKIEHTAFQRFSPSSFDMSARLVPQIRYIGIFDMPVYTAEINLKGSFGGDYPKAAYMYDKASLIFEVRDIKGVTAMPQGFLNGKKLNFEPKLKSVIKYDGVLGGAYNPGYRDDYKGRAYYDYQTAAPDENGSLKVISAPVNFDPSNNTFDINLSLRGSGSFNVAALGKENKITISSDWKDPFFFGNFLPGEKSVTDKGFDASWDISYLASGIPQAFSGLNVSGAMFGVNLSSPVDNYRNGIRAVKHGILFLALTFLACFVFEIVSKNPVHPFQYALVGLAMAVFYLLLISISDFLSFGQAYLIAAAAIVLMIGLYAKYAVIKKNGLKYFLLPAAITAVLYAYLYILLQMQDFSLLFGALGLLGGLAVVMYTTKDISWYE